MDPFPKPRKPRKKRTPTKKIDTCIVREFQKLPKTQSTTARIKEAISRCKRQ